MALADTTFVNLRNALDDLKPLVDATRPVAPKLQQLLVQLRPLASDAVPTVRDLSNIVSRPGADNDLTELTRLGVPLANATVRNIYANGKTPPGRVPGLGHRAERVDPGAGVRPAVRGRPDRLVRGLLAPRASSTPTAPPAGSSACSTGSSAADSGLVNSLPLSQQLNKITQLLFQAGRHQPDHRRPGRPLPGLDGARARSGTPEPGYQCNPSQVPTGP